MVKANSELVSILNEVLSLNAQESNSTAIIHVLPSPQ